MSEVLVADLQQKMFIFNVLRHSHVSIAASGDPKIPGGGNRMAKHVRGIIETRGA